MLCPAIAKPVIFGSVFVFLVGSDIFRRIRRVAEGSMDVKRNRTGARDGERGLKVLEALHIATICGQVVEENWSGNLVAQLGRAYLGNVSMIIVGITRRTRSYMRSYAESGVEPCEEEARVESKGKVLRTE